MGKSALVLGATGVVGRELVRELCESWGYDEVWAWARREIGFCHPKLRARIIDFEGISDIAQHKFDEIFCALGTTMKQAGSREAFLRVDVDYVYAAAKWGKAADVRRFALVSSPGANEGSPSFYLRAKGRIERRVSELGFEDFQIAHLPLILGEKPDAHPQQQIAAMYLNCYLSLGKFGRLAAQVVSATSVIFGSKSYKNSLIFSLYFV